MHIDREWSISFDEQRYISAQGESFLRLLKNPDLLGTFQEALTEIKQLIEPVACWDRFPIREICHEKLVLADGTEIGDGTVVSALNGASELIAAICTIGSAADARIEMYQANKELFKAAILSDLAAWGVDMVRQQLCRRLEENFRQEGLKVSAPLSPGESKWSIRDQKVIFTLLDASQIKVSLNESMVMSPAKSLSLIMGMGTQLAMVEGATHCDFCTMKKRCLRWRLQPNVEPSTV